KTALKNKVGFGMEHIKFAIKPGSATSAGLCALCGKKPSRSYPLTSLRSRYFSSASQAAPKTEPHILRPH
ncbi:MAG: hypothetical protein NTX06_13055, partial [Proteobacteria bacterium]|nr:hypothetical protein [Pseudomonadota bacterium]